jgi:predicted Zn-dependent peptidase
MKPIEIKNESLGEKYFYMKHPSGLNIYVYPKEEYSSTYAIFGTKFGSINNKFKTIDGNIKEVPDGIAHYLEHKLFEGEGIDAFSQYAKTGASANAFTSFDKTAYLFSCTDNFEESLKILLDFVQSPYFTEETVKKEQGIIEQEIKMYEDSSEWNVLLNLLNAMYHNHPIKTDIAGTVESIAKITPELLYDCYENFYSLNNMSLCITGNVDIKTIFSVIDKDLKFKTAKNFKPESIFPEEPREVVKKYVSENFEIALPIFNYGFKEDIKDEEITSEYLAYIDIILYSISSKSSEMYEKLLDEELINMSSFSYEYFHGPNYASIIFSGESKDPKKASKMITKEIKKIHKNGLDKDMFEISKKSLYGQHISIFNSISSMANILLGFSFSNKEFFDYITNLSNANIDTANKIFEKILNPRYTSLSVVNPL